MILQAYAIYDSKAEAYMQPFFVRNDGEALRGFMDGMDNEQSPFHKWPQDYTLFKLGRYDDETGKIDACTPISLGNGLELRKPTRDETKANGRQQVPTQVQ